ncbi:MAG: asparagine synthetase B family protein, partial [Sphaerospermopsis kisseleviana]
MCGITGILNLDGEPVSPLILKNMTDAIAHRGPDGEGQYIDHYLGLGHRRLAIIDLSAAGHQPMMTKDGRLILSFNGEIYNYNELRIELESLGYQFHSHTDTEVVLYAYAQWGEQSLDRFNGMFAFAIWDKHKKELFLARDRYGIKPLYYTFIGNKFLFGSEVKAILANPSYHTEIDLEGLFEYFTFQNFFTDKTLFKNIKLLASGNYLRISLLDKKLIQQQYWDYHFL